MALTAANMPGLACSKTIVRLIVEIVSNGDASAPGTPPLVINGAKVVWFVGPNGIVAMLAKPVRGLSGCHAGAGRGDAGSVAVFQQAQSASGDPVVVDGVAWAGCPPNTQTASNDVAGTNNALKTSDPAIH